MKKSKFIFLIVGVMLVAFVFASCGGGSGGTKTVTWTVTFNYGYEGSPASFTRTVVDGDFVAKPDDPARSSWYFIGWHFENEGKEDIWIFNRIPVTSNVTLTANWSQTGSNITFTSEGQTYFYEEIGLGALVPEPADPTKPGYGFEGWYDGDELWDFTQVIEDADLTLIAKWGGPYSVGQLGPGNGVIFYADYPGDDEDLEGHGITILGYGEEGDDGYFATYTAYYLEFAPGNSSTGANWRARGSVLDVFTKYVLDNDSGRGSAVLPDTNILWTSIGQGRKDTWTIRTWIDNNESSYKTSNAAYLAIDYGSDNQKNDWFLASIGEFYLLRQSGVSGITTGTSYYWASSQSAANYAWRIRLQNGDRDYGGKNDNYLVRAIRAF